MEHQPTDIQALLAPWSLHDCSGARDPAPEPEMRELFRRFRVTRGKQITGLHVSELSLRLSWCAFINRWNTGSNFMAWLERREASRGEHALGPLRQRVHNACWDADRYYYAQIVAGFETEPDRAPAPQPLEVTPVGQLQAEIARLREEQARMAEQIRLSVGVGDDAQTLARDAEESLYRLQHDFDSQRSEMQSLRQSHDAYRTQVRDLN
ncbi:hypothetical protein BBJ28_00026199 [Nothophytophthora sp. Chile5]|nr:hypothetical protein BBJ28_00026199 [Nothophytophthora sp. Chile5]